MQKLLSLCLALMAVLSLCGCGASDDAQEPVILKIGETAATDAAEFTLTEIEFESFTDSELLFTVDFSIKNIGEDTLDDYVAFGDGPESRQISNMIRVRYDKGFIHDFVESYDHMGMPDQYLKIEPATEAQVYYAVANLPAEIGEDPSKPLLLEVALPNERGKTVVFQYDLRDQE